MKKFIIYGDNKVNKYIESLKIANNQLNPKVDKDVENILESLKALYGANQR